MGLPVRIETRTGDTPSHKRARQIERPPDILLDHAGAARAAARPSRGAGASSRPDAGRPRRAAFPRHLEARRPPLARPRPALTLAPRLTASGLSATVREPDELRRYLVPQGAFPPPMGEGWQAGRRASARDHANGALLTACLAGKAGGRAPAPPLHSPRKGEGASNRRSRRRRGRRAARHPHARDRRAAAAGGPHRRRCRCRRSTISSGSTRRRSSSSTRACRRSTCSRSSGSSTTTGSPSRSITARSTSRSAAASRRRWSAGKLKAVVCTVDPRPRHRLGRRRPRRQCRRAEGRVRIMQRIGRSNHRMDEPSKAYLVPANRFEILECRAALDAVHEAAQDTPDARIGALDVLCQHILGMACAEPFDSRTLYDEVRSAAPYAGSVLGGFRGRRRLRRDRRLCAARLRALRQDREGSRTGSGACATRRVAQQYRLNVGTIVEATMIKVRLARRGRAASPARSCRAAGACSARSRNISPRP